MTLVRVIARPLIASSFLMSGVERVRSAGSAASELENLLNTVTKAVPAAAPLRGNERLVAQALGATQVGAAAMLGLGKFSRLSATVLAATAAVNTLVDFKAADSSTRQARKARRTQLLKNLSLIGAVLLAAVDTNGQPGLAWRAEHFAAGARKNASGLGRDARKQLARAEKSVRRTAADVAGA